MNFMRNPTWTISWGIGILTCAFLAFWMMDSLGMPGLPQVIAALVVAAIGGWLFKINTD